MITITKEANMLLCLGTFNSPTLFNLPKLASRSIQKCGTPSVPHNLGEVPLAPPPCGRTSHISTMKQGSLLSFFKKPAAKTNLDSPAAPAASSAKKPASASPKRKPDSCTPSNTSECIQNSLNRPADFLHFSNRTQPRADPTSEKVKTSEPRHQADRKEGEAACVYAVCDI